MQQSRCRRSRREEGQSVVEAAYVIPLLILILCGIIDFGWIFSNQLMVDNCSREGARYAVVNPDAADLTGLVTDKVKSVSGLGDTFDMQVTAEIIDNQDVKVKVTKKVKVLTPVAGIFVPGQEVVLQSTSIMRIG